GAAARSAGEPARRQLSGGRRRIPSAAPGARTPAAAHTTLILERAGYGGAASSASPRGVEPEGGSSGIRDRAGVHRHRDGLLVLARGALITARPARLRSPAGDHNRRRGRR